MATTETKSKKKPVASIEGFDVYVDGRNYKVTKGSTDVYPANLEQVAKYISERLLADKLTKRSEEAVLGLQDLVAESRAHYRLIEVIMKAVSDAE